jgi:hypothetical protein
LLQHFGIRETALVESLDVEAAEALDAKLAALAEQVTGAKAN